MINNQIFTVFESLSRYVYFLNTDKLLIDLIKAYLSKNQAITER